MKKLPHLCLYGSSFLYEIVSFDLVKAATPPSILLVGTPSSSITGAETLTVVSLLSRVESILLYGILPIVVIAVGLYIAYNLLTAEGDESHNKRAWKSVAYGAIGIISIALAYVIIRVALSLQL